MSQNTVKVHFDVGKLKGPSMLMPAPPEYLQQIAQIILLWGQFEVLYDAFLTGLLKHNSTNLDYKWERLNFKKRKMLFQDEMRKAFGVTGGIVGYLRKLNDDASHLHVPRNALVHGQISLDTKETETILFSTTRHNGKELVLKFDAEKIEKLLYDMMYLGGRLNTFNKPPDYANFVVPGLSSQERQTLRAFLRNNLPTPPMPPTSGRQRPPSRPLPQKDNA